MPPQPQSLILASASPRRRRLLESAGFKFEVIASGVNESDIPSEGKSPAQFAADAALAKARDIAPKHPRSLVIGADTVVDFEGHIIGKPTDEKDADRIIRLLFSKPHKVITAVALLQVADHTEIVADDTTTIFPNILTEKQITDYIATGRWRGKAGAYGIRPDDPFIDHIEGSLSNVMGLPMELLTELFKDLLP